MSDHPPVADSQTQEKTEKLDEIVIPAIQNDLECISKSRWERSWPIIACGAGLFSDGYLNNVRHDPTILHMHLQKILLRTT